MKTKMMNNKKIYVASPIDTLKTFDRVAVEEILEMKGFEVYSPSQHHIPNAWDYPNTEWGLMVFQNDIEAIQNSDYVVMLSYGRDSTAGSNWEAGYAFGIGKKVIVIEMTDEPMSLMVANGRYATVKGVDGIKNYDWDKMPKSRTNTEQK